MKKLLYFSILIWISGVHGQPLTELDSAEYFDFWVGEWTASWDEGNGVEQFGTNTIEKQLDGKVLVENFRITSGKNAGFKGTSISVFQPRANQWKQAWADNQGGYFNFSGAFEADRRIFQTEVFDRNGQKVQQRMIFYNIEEDSMTWDWEMSQDGGESWNLVWRIFYERAT